MSKPHRSAFPPNSHSSNRVAPSWVERFFWRLSGADADLLRSECPGWERVKYGAFGASVLVPMVFGMIASSYAVSTLTDSLLVIVGFAIIWGLIILAIDRVLLSTYRAYVSTKRKVLQFVLRVSVAVLMGLTVSHPMALLIFKDTIISEVEKRRSDEMLAIRESALEQKKIQESRILAANEHLASLQKKYEDTLSGNFLDRQEAPAPDFVAAKQAPVSDFSELDVQIENIRTERDQMRRELEQWQATYDEEIRGIRSGKVGIGPNARAIERDNLTWRREEVQRLNTIMTSLIQQRTEMAASVVAANTQGSAEVAASRRQLEKQKIEVFASQQGQMLDIINSQIKQGSEEVARLTGEASLLTMQTNERIDAVKMEKRGDLMTQTLVLHDIFKKPDGSGFFALMVYVILAGLFTLIDTIPLVVKFFAVPGPYDAFIEAKSSISYPMVEGDYTPEFREAMMNCGLISVLHKGVGMPQNQRRWEKESNIEIVAEKVPTLALLPPPDLRNRVSSVDGYVASEIPNIHLPALHKRNVAFDNGAIEIENMATEAFSIEIAEAPKPLTLVTVAKDLDSYFQNREISFPTLVEESKEVESVDPEIGTVAVLSEDETKVLYPEDEKRFATMGFGEVIKEEQIQISEPISPASESSARTTFRSLRTVAVPG